MGRTVESLRVLNGLKFNAGEPQDVTADRVDGTWYQNDKKFPLIVNVSTETDGTAAAAAGVDLHINSVKVDNVVKTDQSQAADSANSVAVKANVTETVPSGFYYKATTSGAAAWTERELGKG